MTADRPPRRAGAAATLLAVAASGCATHDYGYARATRFDRPYQGGAASVPDERPAPTSSSCTSDADVVGELAYVAALVIAYAGHAGFSVRPAPPPPPPPPGR